MERNNWNELKDRLVEMDNAIFKSVDKSKLSDYEKRKMIFNYLCNTITYDYDHLNIIIGISKKIINNYPRNPFAEVKNVIFDKKGVCNGIAQTYRLLLELNDIYSLCVNCDNNMEVPHQLNLVYDKTTKSYSFDDVTSVIVGVDKQENLFDYDLEFAHSIGQGTKKILDEPQGEWVFLPACYLDIIVNRESDFHKAYGIDNDTNWQIPSNIKSVKPKDHIK